MKYDPALAKTAGNYDHAQRECATDGLVPFYRPYKSTDPLRCTVCESPERWGGTDDEPAPAANGFEHPPRLVPRVAPLVPAMVREYEDAAAQATACPHVYVLGACACRLCGFEPKPAVLPGAATAMAEDLRMAQARIAALEDLASTISDQRDKLIDEWQAEAERLRVRVVDLEASRDAALGDLAAANGAHLQMTDALNARIAELEGEAREHWHIRREKTARIAELEADAKLCRAERDAAREQLRELAMCVIGWINAPGQPSFMPLAAAARAAIDGTALAPRDAEIEGLIAAIHEANVHRGQWNKEHITMPLERWRRVIEARDAYEKARGNRG